MIAGLIITAGLLSMPLSQEPPEPYSCVRCCKLDNRIYDLSDEIAAKEAACKALQDIYWDAYDEYITCASEQGFQHPECITLSTRMTAAHADYAVCQEELDELRRELDQKMNDFANRCDHYSTECECDTDCDCDN